MLEFLNNLFAQPNQQIPTALMNPANASPVMDAQEVYNRQIAPWMRPGIQSPMDQTQFTAVETPMGMQPPMSPEMQQAAQQQDMLRRYAEANMARAGGQPSFVEQPTYVGEAFDEKLPPNYQETPTIAAPEFQYDRRLPMEPIPADKEMSEEEADSIMMSSQEAPMLYQLLGLFSGGPALDLGNPQPAEMTREAAGYVPARKRNLLGIQ